jgi:hypothetical protein
MLPDLYLHFSSTGGEEIPDCEAGPAQAPLLADYNAHLSHLHLLLSLSTYHINDEVYLMMLLKGLPYLYNSTQSLSTPQAPRALEVALSVMHNHKCILKQQEDTNSMSTALHTPMLLASNPLMATTIGCLEKGIHAAHTASVPLTLTVTT